MNSSKKFFSIMLVLLLLIPFIPTGYANSSSPSQWAVAEIEEAKVNELVTSKILNNYQQNITREEFAELAVKLYESLSQDTATTPSSNPFVDTENSEILKAYHLGIVGGVATNRFAPQQSITREEIAVMLHRVIRVSKSVTNFFTPQPMRFTDSSSVSPWAFDAILYLNYQGIIGGVGNNHVDPKGKTTREQAIVLVLRSFKQFSKEPTTMTVGTSFFPRSFDLHATNDLSSSRVMAQLYETLLTLDENNNIAPGLASSWRQIDPLTYEFELKKDVLFHNGETLSANDVAFSLKRAINSPYTGHIVNQLDPDKIKVINDNTIRISTLTPHTPILHTLTHIQTGILNEQTVLFAGDNYHGMFAVGTGPYQYHFDDGKSFLKLSSFKYYHGTKAKSDFVIIKAISGLEQSLSALESGEIDIAYDLSPAVAERISANRDLTLYRDANQSTSYVGLNNESGPLKDVRVRQAINYAIDTDSIVKEVYSTGGIPAQGPISPNIFGAHPDLQTYDLNIEKAKKLLTEAGYPNGFKTSVTINESQQRQAIAEMMQSQLALVNIKLEIKVLDFGAFLDATSRGDFDMFILGWVTVTGDADYGLYSQFHTAMAGSMGNRSFYSNPRVDELLDLARTTTDLAKRQQYYHEAQEIITNDAPWIYLSHGENISATSKNITGFKQQPQGYALLSTVEIKK